MVLEVDDWKAAFWANVFGKRKENLLSNCHSHDRKIHTDFDLSGVYIFSNIYFLRNMHRVLGPITKKHVHFISIILHQCSKIRLKDNCRYMYLIPTQNLNDVGIE